MFSEESTCCTYSYPKVVVVRLSEYYGSSYLVKRHNCSAVQITRLMRYDEHYAELVAPRNRELQSPVRVWDKGVILPGAWIMCTRDYTLVFQDLDSNDESLCEVIAKSGKKMYRSIFASRLLELERILPGLMCVVRLENFGLVGSGWFFWGMNILHSSSFDELFKYLLSGREVFVTRLSTAGQSTLIL